MNFFLKMRCQSIPLTEYFACWPRLATRACHTRPMHAHKPTHNTYTYMHTMIMQRVHKLRSVQRLQTRPSPVRWMHDMLRGSPTYRVSPIPRTVLVRVISVYR